MREELVKSGAASPADVVDADVAAEVADEPPSPEELRAFDHARALVDAGIRRGFWRAVDRTALRESLQQVPGSLQEDVIRPLVVAANRDQLKVETDSLY
jgi:hypothetical protein